MLYAGKTEDKTEAGLAYKLVRQLAAPFEFTGRLACIDNWFSSPTLFSDLYAVGIFALGTVQANRKGMPVELELPKTAKRGDFVAKTDGVMSTFVWQDKKQVRILSTEHSMSDVGTVLRRNSKGKKEPVAAPKALVDYQAFMGGVDMATRIRAYLSCVRKTPRFWVAIFMYLIDMCVANSRVLANHHDTRRFTRMLQWRVELSNGLLECWTSPRTRLDQYGAIAATKSSGKDCWPSEYARISRSGKTRQGRCVECGGKSQLACEQHKVCLCTLCFRPYHQGRQHKRRT